MLRVPLAAAAWLDELEGAAAQLALITAREDVPHAAVAQGAVQLSEVCLQHELHELAELIAALQASLAAARTAGGTALFDGLALCAQSLGTLSPAWVEGILAAWDEAAAFSETLVAEAMG
jgi:hypothetical protein